MNWVIPAKTFLLGEYVALQGGPALLVNHYSRVLPYQRRASSGLSGVHPDAPAARFWQKNAPNSGLLWQDPYQGFGGLGASTAQYLGAYCAAMQWAQQPIHASSLWRDYLASSWSGDGTPPSGYDVLAQALHGCVFLHKQQAACEVLTWPWPDLTFILVHTGKKLATHTYLSQLSLPNIPSSLVDWVFSAQQALKTADSALLIASINAYHAALTALNLVALTSLQQMERLKPNPDILAMKGCGAMGADVILLLVRTERMPLVCTKLRKQGLVVLATSAELYSGPGLLCPQDIFLADCY